MITYQIGYRLATVVGSLLIQGKIIFKTFLLYYIINIKSNQRHAVSSTQQGRKMEPSVKTLPSPLSAGFWRHCVLSDITQRRALPRHQSEEMEI